MLQNINSAWYDFFSEELKKPYFKSIFSFLTQERTNGKIIFPDQDKIFSAFEFCSLEQLKVVILGQDPYHQSGQAHGLAFSVPVGQKIPPSLRNIFKELVSDLDIDLPVSGDLTSWAKQGVLLLNTALTVEQSKANGHSHIGWNQFIINIIEYLNVQKKYIVYVLWGTNAQMYSKYISSKHYKIMGAHPSPLSSYRGFFGSKPFSEINRLLIENNIEKIDWKI